MYEPANRSDPRVYVDLVHLQAFERHAQRISFLPKQPARSVLAGRHNSKIRGRGLNFEELRHYQKGDDVRTIDWKVTARTREPHVRVYTEERDRPVLLIVDQRMSMFFGTARNMKSVTAAEAAALSAWRIRMQSDRVGGVIFSDTNVAELAPKASGMALNRFLSALAQANNALGPEVRPEPTITFNDVLRATARIAKTGMMVLIFSDFTGVTEESELLLRKIVSHNDVLLFPITHMQGQTVPHDLRIVATDGSKQVTLDAATSAVTRDIIGLAEKRMSYLLSWERKFGIPVLPLWSSNDTATQLLRLLGVGGAP